jgi:hypothetical protein
MAQWQGIKHSTTAFMAKKGYEQRKFFVLLLGNRSDLGRLGENFKKLVIASKGVR